MSSKKAHDIKNVEAYVRNVSSVSGLNLNEDRLKPHFPEFLRLLNDVEELNDLVTGREFLHVGPVTTYTHTKHSLDKKQG